MCVCVCVCMCACKCIYRYLTQFTNIDSICTAASVRYNLKCISHLEQVFTRLISVMVHDFILHVQSYKGNLQVQLST